MTTSDAKKMKVTVLSDTEVSLTREFSAPRQMVFAAFTQKEHLERWWGLRETTTRVEKLDFRTGGAWQFVERAADGNEYVFFGKFLEIKKPEKFVWTFEFDGYPGHVTQTTFLFTEESNKTKLTATVQFTSTEDRDQMVGAGMERGAAESYDMLDELLAELKSKK